MSATFNWAISTLERDLLPEDMAGAVVTSHWRVTAEQSEGTPPPPMARKATPQTPLLKGTLPMMT